MHTVVSFKSDMQRPWGRDWSRTIFRSRLRLPTRKVVPDLSVNTLNDVILMLYQFVLQCIFLYILTKATIQRGHNPEGKIWSTDLYHWCPIVWKDHEKSGKKIKIWLDFHTRILSTSESSVNTAMTFFESVSKTADLHNSTASWTTSSSVPDRSQLTLRRPVPMPQSAPWNQVIFFNTK